MLPTPVLIRLGLAGVAVLAGVYVAFAGKKKADTPAADRKSRGGDTHIYMEGGKIEPADVKAEAVAKAKEEADAKVKEEADAKAKEEAAAKLAAENKNKK